MNIRINAKPLVGEVNAPGSKSETQRALFIAFGKTTKTMIFNPNMGQDIEETIYNLRLLGAKIKWNEKVIIIKGPKKINDVDTLKVNYSGTTLRFLIPLLLINNLRPVILISKTLAKRLTNDEFKDLGIKLNISEDKIQLLDIALDFKQPLKMSNTSQLLSGLMIVQAQKLGMISLAKPIDPYLNLTIAMLNAFGYQYQLDDKLQSKTYHFIKRRVKNKIKINGDFSIGAYLLAIGLNGDVTVSNLNIMCAQGDKAFIKILEKANANIIIKDKKIEVKNSTLTPLDVDLANIPDLGPILMAIAITINDKSHFYHLARLTHKESNRIQDVVQILREFGATIVEGVDELWITGPTSLNEKLAVSSLNDHRIVMMLGFLSIYLKEPITINNAEAVRKSYPNYFKDFIKLKGEFLNEDLSISDAKYNN